MDSRSSSIFSLAALAVGFGVMAIPASAQHAVVHMPVTVHWGPTVLEPGDYNLSTPSEWAGSRLICVSQRGHSRMILPQSSEIQHPHLDRSSLELVKVNGAYFVKQYKSAITGQVFTFPAPKATREAEMASASVTTIPINSSR